MLHTLLNSPLSKSVEAVIMVATRTTCLLHHQQLNDYKIIVILKRSGSLKAKRPSLKHLKRQQEATKAAN